MRAGLLCSLLLLPGCSFFWPSPEREVYEYSLTWYCVSLEGCEHMEEAARIDRATDTGESFIFTSTQDPSFREQALPIISQTLPGGCFWLHELSFFGRDLERSRICTTAGGFELELSIPNEDPTTHSEWVVSGRETRLQ